MDLLAGWILNRLGRPEDALPHVERAFEALRDALGPTHERTLNAWNGLAVTLSALGRHEESERTFRALLDASEAALPADSDTLAWFRKRYADSLADQGRVGEARAVVTLALHEAAPDAPTRGALEELSQRLGGQGGGAAWDG